MYQSRLEEQRECRAAANFSQLLREKSFSEILRLGKEDFFKTMSSLYDEKPPTVPRPDWYFDAPTQLPVALSKKATREWKEREAQMTVTSFKSAQEDPMYFAPPLVLNDKIGYLEGELTAARGKIEKLEEQLESSGKGDRKRMFRDEPAPFSVKRSAPGDRRLEEMNAESPAEEEESSRWEEKCTTLEAKNAELAEILRNKDDRIQRILKQLDIRTSESHDLCKLYIQRGKEHDEKKREWKLSDGLKDMEIEEFGIILGERDDEIEELKEQKKMEIAKLQEALNQKTSELQKSNAEIQKLRDMQSRLKETTSDVEKKDSEILSLRKQLEECRQRQAFKDEQSEQSDDSFEKVSSEDSEGSESGWSHVGGDEDDEREDF